MTQPSQSTPLSSDPINPPHYTQGRIECIDAIEAALTLEEFNGFLKGTVLAYIWREKHKGGLEDWKKARWYLERGINCYEKQPNDHTTT
jgi:7-cyano-7-deazaguanine synthase in queuosine biosynthesis